MGFSGVGALAAGFLRRGLDLAGNLVVAYRTLLVRDMRLKRKHGARPKATFR